MPGDRIEGQIWISRDAPNILKYFAGATEYWSVSATTYTAATAISKGTIVAIDSAASGKVVPAVWPRDARRIVGMALNTATFGSEVRTLTYGYVEFSAAEIAAMFVTQSDYKASAALTGSNYYTAFGTADDGGAGNGWNDVAGYNGLGAPLYMFIGRHLKTSTGYSWKDPASYAGKLTFSTPTGYKPTSTEVPWGDDAFNVSYKNLPQIGSVAAYTYDPSTKVLASLVVHINFSTFAREIQFEYPAKGVAAYQGASIATAVTKSLYHGLFPTVGGANVNVPATTVQGWGCESAVETPAGSGIYVFSSDTANNFFSMQPGYDSYLAGDTRRTEFEIESDSGFYYKVVGTVHYGY